MSRQSWILAAAGLALAGGPARADVPVLLQSALSPWTSNQTDWAFVRLTRTIDGKGAVKDERVENYDPSRPDSDRWHLVQVDGRSPNPVELAGEEKKNHRAKRFGGEQPASLLDLPKATVRRETADDVVYNVPVKSMPGGLAQTDRLEVLVAVDKATGSVARLTAQLRGPMRLALGLAKITDVDLDLSFVPSDSGPAADTTPKGGTARATLSAFGEHMEYVWSDFRSVPAHG
ncbi:MAG TPA: hypothetical protein VGL42_05040 [Opitutaceae bacterium]|jgi:hypothetical protein